MRTETRRTKTLGAAAAMTAVLLAVPTAVQAYAEPTPSPTPASPTSATSASPASPAPASPSSSDPAAPTTSQMPVPASGPVPDPVGPGCDAYRSKNGSGSSAFGVMATKTATQALASNPDLSTFSGLISGKLNPDVNIDSVLDGGPYVVFAPTNAAFAKLDATTMETYKTNPIVLVPVLFYHMVLGYLNPNDVAGKMPTQDGRPVVVTGKGGDVKVNDVKLVCAYPARGAYIYMIDSVLTPPTPAAEAAGATTSGTTSATTAASTAASTSASESPAASTSASPSATSSASGTSSASETPASASTSATASSSAASASESPASASATTTTAKPAA